MNKQKVNERTKAILLSIHRGFLTEEASANLTDEEILGMIPPNSTNPVPASLDSEDRVRKLTPFTEKWVRKQVKRNINITALEILIACGFKEATDS